MASNVAEIIVRARDETQKAMASATRATIGLAKKTEAVNEQLISSIESMSVDIITDAKQRVKAQARIEIKAVKKSIGNAELKTASIELIEKKLAQDVIAIKKKEARVEARIREKAVADAQKRSISIIAAASAGFLAITKGAQILGQAFRIVGRIIGLVTDKISAYVEAASIQEKAEKQLSVAIQNTGGNLDELLPKLKAQASEIQRNTVVGDEAALAYQALAINMGVSADKAGLATQAAIDLAAAMGVDARTAVMGLAKSLTGLLDRNLATIPGIKDLTAAELKAGKAIDLVAAKFAGAAAKTMTLVDRVTQAKNAYGDMQEQIGFSITKSKALNEVITVLNKALADAAETDLGTVLGEGLALGAAAAANAVTYLVAAMKTALEAAALFGHLMPGFGQVADDLDSTIARLDEIGLAAAKLALDLNDAAASTGKLSDELTDEQKALAAAAKAAREKAEAEDKAKKAAKAHREEVEKINEALFASIQAMGMDLIKDDEERFRAQADLEMQAIFDSIASRELKGAAIAAIEAKLDQDLEGLRLETAQKKKDEDQLAFEEWEAKQQRMLDVLQSNVTTRLAFEKEGKDKEKALVTASAKHIGAVSAELLTAGMQGKEEAFQAIKAILAREAAMSIATAILSPSSGIPFPANLILAPIAAAAAMALIQSFHTGGIVPKAATGMVMGPDERLVRAEVGEGIITAQGIQRIGGPGVLGAVNAGTAGGAGAGIVINIQAHDAASVEASFSEGGDMNRAFKRAQSRGDI